MLAGNASNAAKKRKRHRAIADVSTSVARLSSSGFISSDSIPTDPNERFRIQITPKGFDAFMPELSTEGEEHLDTVCNEFIAQGKRWSDDHKRLVRAMFRIWLDAKDNG